MPAWATVTLTLGSTSLAILGTLAGTRLQNWYARRERLEAERTKRREEGAAILAPIANLLIDVDPMRLGLYASPNVLEKLTKLNEEQWVPLRNRLTTYGESHPSAAVDLAAARLSVAVMNVLGMGYAVVKDVLDHADKELTLKRARSDYERARELLDVFRVAVRGQVADDELVRQVAAVELKADAVDADGL